MSISLVSRLLLIACLTASTLSADPTVDVSSLDLTSSGEPLMFNISVPSGPQYEYCRISYNIQVMGSGVTVSPSSGSFDTTSSSSGRSTKITVTPASTGGGSGTIKINWTVGNLTSGPGQNMCNSKGSGMVSVPFLVTGGGTTPPSDDGTTPPTRPDNHLPVLCQYLGNTWSTPLPLWGAANDCQVLHVEGLTDPGPSGEEFDANVQGGDFPGWETWAFQNQQLRIDSNRNPVNLDLLVCPNGPNGVAPVGSQTFTIPFVILDGDEPKETCTITSSTDVGPPTMYGTLNVLSTGDPVSLATGEFHDSAVLKPDLSLGGPLLFRFVRYYGSLLIAGNFVDGVLGNNWMHNYDHSLERIGNFAMVRVFGGRRIRFHLEDDVWRLNSVEKLLHQLQSTADGGYLFLDLETNLTYAFDADGRLTRISDRNGNALTITPSAEAPGPALVEDSLGRSLAFDYLSGKLRSVTDHTGRRVAFRYFGDNLGVVTDALGGETTYRYTAQGRMRGLLTATTLPDGMTPVSQRYDAEGRVSEQTDGVGARTVLQYGQVEGPGGNTTAETDPLGGMRRATHAGFDNLMESVDQSGARRALTYDQNRRLVSYVNPNGDRVEVFYHDPSGYFAGLRNFTGEEFRLEYQEQEQGGFRYFVPTAFAFPDGTRATMENDARGNITKVIAQDGGAWEFTYTQQGRMFSIINPSGGRVLNSFNADLTIASARLPDGALIAYEYDALGRLTKFKYPDGTERTIAYDANNNVTATTDSRGAGIVSVLDAQGRATRITDQMGAEMTFEYNDNGKLIRFVNRTGGEYRYVWNDNGRVAEIHDPSGKVISIEYDERGLPITVRDQVGVVGRLEYDDVGRLVASSDALGHTIRQALDAAGLPIEETQPSGAVIKFEYDSMGRFQSITDQMGRMTNYRYSPQGYPTHIGKAGVTAEFAYNAYGNLISTRDPNGGVWMREFDKQGFQTSLSDPLGRAIRYTHNGRRWLTRIETPEGTISNEFDGQGNVIRRDLSDGTTLTYTYDEMDRMVAADGLELIYNAGSKAVGSNGLVFERDANNRITAVTYAPGRTVRYVYDQRGRISKVTDWLGGETTFEHDAAGRPTRIVRPNGVVTNIVYDADDGILSITESRGGVVLASTELRRNAAGEPVFADRNLPIDVEPAPGMLPMSYDAAHQIEGARFDGRGRLVSDGIRNYRWNIVNNLVGYDGQDGAAEFTYDAIGNRISRTAGAMTHTYVLNYALTLPSVAIVRSGGADETYYVWLRNGTLLYAIDAAGGTRSFYHFDETGNTTILTDDAGAVTDAYAVSPFGEDVAHQGSSTQPFIYQGRFGVMKEPGVDLYYMRARWYDGDLARFLTRDPVATLDPLHANPYSYAANNPMAYTDPSGMSAQQLVLDSAIGPDTFLGSCPDSGSPYFQLGGLGTGWSNFHIKDYEQTARALDRTWGRVLQRYNPDDMVRFFARGGAPEAAFGTRLGSVARWWHGTAELGFDLGPTARAALPIAGEAHLVGDAARLASTGRLAAVARVIRPIGTTVAVLGVGLNGVVVAADGITNGDGAAVVTYDTTVSVGVDVAVLATVSSNPAVLVVDAVTLGAGSASVKNAFTGAQVVCDLATGGNPDPRAVKRRMTRNWFTKELWWAGDTWSNRGVGGTFSALFGLNE